MIKYILAILMVFILIVGCTAKNNTETTLPGNETTECSAAEGTVIPEGTSTPEEATTSPETTEAATVPETTEATTVPETTEATTVPETTEDPTVPETTEAPAEEPNGTETKPNGDVGNVGEDD